jgi:hypothetical protein
VRRELNLSDVPNPPKVVALSPVEHGKALTTSNGGGKTSGGEPPRE